MVYTGKNFTPDSWFKGLKAGNTFVTNGPAVFLTADGKLPGSEIVKSSGSSLKLSLKSYSHKKIGTISKMAIYNNEGLIAELDNKKGLDSIELKLDHKLTRSQWIAAVVNCENGAVAHTTPIYAVVDNKPTYDVNKGPEIIDRQIKSIEAIIKEETSKATLDRGIIQRLETAVQFYKMLLKQMSEEKNGVKNN
jgi:hypothetical protein